MKKYSITKILLLHFLILFLFLKLIQNQCGYPYQRCICTSSTPYCPCSFITSTQTLNTSSSYISHLVNINGYGCRPCQSNCKKCSSTETCQQCFDQYQLLNNNCIACSINCKKCKNSICLECIESYYLDYQNKCQKCPLIGTKTCTIDSLRSCQANYWMDNNGAECISCDPNCKICSSTTKCSKCLDGYYQSSFTCKTCKIQCKTCINSISCIDCLVSGYFYNSSKGSCISCPANCLTCNSNGFCTLCQSKNSYVLSKSTNQCVLALNTPSQTSKNCLNITFTASTSSYLCQLCQIGYYQLRGSFNTTGSIQKCFYGCSILCKNCTGPHYGLCDQCKDQTNFYMINRNCIPYYNINDGTAFQLYYTALNNNQMFQGGTLITPNSCWQQYVKGGTNKISVSLSKLQSYKIVLKWKIYKYNFSSGDYSSILANQTYQVTLANDLTSQNQSLYYSSSFSPQLCEDRTNFSSLCTNSPLKQCISKNQIVFQNFISYEKNIIQFKSSNSLIAISQLLVIGYRCGGLYGDGCAQCTDINTCTKCKNSNYFILGQKCVIQCPNTHYTYYQMKTCYQICPSKSYSDNSLHQCLSCQSPCQKCYSKTQCITCREGFYYNKLNKKCQAECPSKFYQDGFRKVCEKCVYPCFQCLDNIYCLSCRYGFLQISNQTGKNQGKCVLQCKDGYYGDLNTVKCQKCQNPCQNCNSLGDLCTSCISQYFLDQNQCVKNCSLGYYGDNFGQICKKCPQSCQTCVNHTYCTSCKVGNYLLSLTTNQSTCFSECPFNYFKNQVLLICSLCNINCKTCKSYQICSSCILGYYFYQQNYECVKQCPQFYFKDINNKTNQKICSRCQLPCYDCLSNTQCLSCYDSFLNNGSCTLICDIGTFANVTSLKCQACNLEKCLQCKLKPDYCIKCKNGLFLTEGQCISKCPANFYFSQYKQQCILCVGFCQTCKNQTFCLSCITGYLFLNQTGQCVNQCELGYFKYLNQTDNSAKCLQCSIHCKQCKSSNDSNLLSICVLCVQEYVFYKGVCLSSCPDGYFNFSNYCYVCLDPCSKCNQNQECLQCKSGTGFLYQGTCITQCPYGYYQSSDNKCQKCSSSCLLCQGKATQCTVCVQKYYLQIVPLNNNYSQFDQKCVQTCDNGYYQSISDFKCQKCSQNCKTCFNAFQNCTSCKNSLLLYKNMCFQTCPLTTYHFQNATQNYCKKCPLQCKYCKNQTFCTFCSQNYFLQSNNKCLSNCSINKYGFDGKCRSCQYPCLTCIDSDKCSSCKIGLLYQTDCVDSCPYGSFYSLNSLKQQICIKCAQNCSSCTSLQNCLICFMGILSKGYCKSQCPEGSYNYYGNCLDCDQKCITCKNSSSCIKCKTAYFYNGDCFDNCPSGYVGQNITNNNTSLLQYNLICSKCTNNCKQCIISPNKCIQCLSTYYLYLDTCIKQCPLGSYHDDKLQICQMCVSPCQTCTNAHSCQTCIYGYLLYREFQRNQCVQGPLCPNSYYLNIDSSICQFVCPSNYYIQDTYKTCSKTCLKGFVTYQANKSCLKTCPQFMWVDQNLICQQNSSIPEILPELKCEKNIIRNRLFLICNSNVPLKNIHQLKPIYFNLNSEGFIQSIYFKSKTKFYILIENIQQSIKESYITLQITEKYFLIAQISSSNNVKLKEQSQINDKKVRANIQKKYPVQNNFIQIFIEKYTSYTIQQRQIGMSFYQIAKSISYGALVLWFFSLIKNIKSTSMLLLINLQWLFSLSLLAQKSNFSPNFNQFLQGFKTSCLFDMGLTISPLNQNNLWIIQQQQRTQFWAINNFYELNQSLAPIYIIIGIFLFFYILTLICVKIFNHYPQNQSLNKLQKKFTIIKDRFIFNYTFQLILFSVIPITICSNLQYIRPTLSNFIIAIFFTVFYIVFNIYMLWLYSQYNINKIENKDKKPLRSTQFFYVAYFDMLIQTSVIIWSSFQFYIGFGTVAIILKIVAYFLIFQKVQAKRTFSLQSIQICKGLILILLVVGQMKSDDWDKEQIYYFGFAQIIAVLLLIIICLICVSKQIFALQSSYKSKNTRKDFHQIDQHQNISINARLKNSNDKQYQQKLLQNSQYDQDSDLDDQRSFFTYHQPAIYSEDQQSSDGDIIDFDQDSFKQEQDQNGNKIKKQINAPPKHLFRFQKKQQDLQQNTQNERKQQ